MTTPTKYQLDEAQMPRAWYNIQADLPVALPPVLHPGTLQPIGPADLAPLFPMDLILQEVSTEREIEIPEPVREVYRLWRPSPLYRAHRLEKALGTPAKIFYKYEGVSPAGSHKPNTAVPQAFFNALQRAFSSRAANASYPRRRQIMRSKAPLKRRYAVSAKDARKPSCSTCADMGTST